jgi:hypothetical protein
MKVIKKIINKILNSIIGVVQFIYIRLLPLIIYLIALYYTYILIADFTKDTTLITNTAFGICASLAALSFSCSRSLMDSKEDKDRFSYAGERFFHAAVLLISTSLVRYLVLSVLDSNFFQEKSFQLAIIKSFAGVYIVTIFFWAVTSSVGALIVINKLLWKRFNKYPDWDNFI